MGIWEKLKGKGTAKRLSDEELVKSDSFCMMPWVHLHVTQHGTVTPCCQAPWEEEHAFGNLNDSTVEHIWHGKKMNAFRSGMLKGQKDERCWRCYEKDASGALSLRKTTNDNYKHKLDWVFETKTNGEVNEAFPIYFDVRFSNVCNLKCHICGPWASSQWHQDAIALGMLPKDSKALTKAFTDHTVLFDQIDPFLDTIEEVYFAGGEPLVMEEHYEFLEKLIARKRFDVKLMYNTNFSKLEFKSWKAIELWKNFKHINIAASLDASGDRGAYLRKNLVWEDVVNNRKTLMQELPQADFMLSPTTYIYNVLHLPDFHREWTEMGFIKPESFVPTILIDPPAYNIRVLPEFLKKEVIEKYEQHLRWLTAQAFSDEKLGPHTVRQFQNIITHLKGEDKSGLLTEFHQKNQALDKLRQENAAEIFPELGVLFDQLTTSI